MFFRHLIPAFFWAIFILTLSIMPSGNIAKTDINSIDKIVHFIVYLLQTHLIIVGFKKQKQFIYLNYHAIIIAVLFSVFYGILMEIIQGTIFVYRSVEMLDIVANSLGAVAGVLSFRIIYGKI